MLLCFQHGMLEARQRCNKGTQNAQEAASLSEKVGSCAVHVEINVVSDETCDSSRDS